MSKELIRAFIAVPLSAGLREQIEPIQRRLRCTTAKVKWVEPQNLHFTLKFLGDLGASGVKRVLSAMERAADGIQSFDLELAGVGTFPTPRRPRVVWVGAGQGAEPLTGLASRVEDELGRLGFEREKRPFRAHLTIGRVRDPGRGGDLADLLEAEPAASLGSMSVDSFELMQSDLRPTGPIYTSLGTIELTPQ